MPALRSLLCALLFAGLLSACQSDAPSNPGSADADFPPADSVVARSIRAHGGDVLDHAEMTFRFRDARFRLLHDGGRFRYERRYTDSLGRSVREVLSNDSLYRAVEGKRVALSDEERADVETAVNSVAYFALLPQPLHDPAVQATYDARESIDGEDYHRLVVTFQQEGGGKDWQDRFVYWFDADTYTMDFLAYAYGFGSPDEEVGTRFREAYNVRPVQGVRVADYRNYAYDDLPPEQMPRYPDLWLQDSLRRVSTVDLDSVAVRPLR
mgnify:CR=1 FL=1